MPQAICLFVVDLLILMVTAFCAACHFNYPRFWWQEVVCGATLVWLPLVFFSVARAAVRIYKGRRNVGISVLVAIFGSYTVGQSLSVVWPYITHAAGVKLTKDEGIPVGIFHVHGSSDLQERQALEENLKRLLPDILVVTGAANLSETEGSLAARFSHSLRSAEQSPHTIRLFSRFPLLHESRSDLGFGSLAGIHTKIALEEDVVLELGAVSLRGSFSLQSFEQSRVTSRRLASIMRNSISPRMVVGDFSATPLSQIVSMYNRQARMRSVFYGEGIAAFAAMQSVMTPVQNINAFVSAGVEVTDAVVIAGSDNAPRSLFITINVPRITVIPIER